MRNDDYRAGLHERFEIADRIVYAWPFAQKYGPHENFYRFILFSWHNPAVILTISVGCGMFQTPDPRIKRLVQSCTGLTPEERHEYLERECAGDEKLRSSVENMVDVGDPGSSPTQAFSNDYEQALPGHYRLIRMIGRGGMAEVFLAEDRRLNRSVAI